MTKLTQGTFVATDSESPSVTQSIVNKANYPIIKLPFPPVIEPKDLIVRKKSLQGNPDSKPTRAPNAFIIYRKVFVKSARDQGFVLPMTLVSPMASASWDQESEEVKDVYKKIAKETHKLVKQMYPKKSNQRKQKEKWNLVSFQKDNKSHPPKDKPERLQDSTQNPTNTPNFSPLPLTPVSTTSSSPLMSSPSLSELDTSVTETSPLLQQQSIFFPTTNNYEGQIFDNYFPVDEFNNVDLPDSFQEYLNQPVNDYNYLLETYSYPTLNELPDTSMDNLKESVFNNNIQPPLNLTLADVLGILNSENFDLGIEL